MNEWNELIGKKVIEIKLNVNGELLEIHDREDVEFQDKEISRAESKMSRIGLVCI